MVLKEVPENSTVVGVPAKVVRQNGKKIERKPLDQIHLPDPIEQEIKALKSEIKSLKAQMNKKGEK